MPEVMGMQLEGTPYLHERPQGVDTDPLHKVLALSIFVLYWNLMNLPYLFFFFAYSM